MRVALLAFTIVFLSSVRALGASAQDIRDPSKGVEGPDEVTSTAQVLSSFEALPLILSVGQEIKVRSDTDRTIRGRVVSIAGSELVVGVPQFPFPQFRARKKQAMAKDLVQSIAVVDSNWNGAIIGAASMAAAIEIGCWNCRRGNLWGMVYLYAVMPAGIAGAVIDGLRTQTVYERQPKETRITLAPLLGQNMLAVSAYVRF